MFKRYIYQNKDNKNGFSISGLNAFIKSIENSEQHIAQERDKLECQERDKLECVCVCFTQERFSNFGNNRFFKRRHWQKNLVSNEEFHR